MPKERYAGRVQVHANLIHARFDDGVERVLELPGADIVLIQADTDVLRIDLDQLAERVLQPAADGDGAAQRGIVAGKLFTADRTGGVHACPGFVNDDVRQIGGWRR